MSTTISVPQARPELAGAGLRAFFRIAQKWGLSDGEARCLLGSPVSAVYSRWKRDQEGPVPVDTLERISYILGIYKALHLLFTEPAQADSWVRRSNAAPMFGGRSALDRMMAGCVADLSAVRQVPRGPARLAPQSGATSSDPPAGGSPAQINYRA